MNSVELGRKIAELRKLKAMTQEELADRTGLSVRTIQRIESGEVDPRTHTLNVLADALEIDMKDLLEEDQEEVKTDVLTTNNWLALLHLSGLFVLLVPPLIIWILKRKDIPEMKTHGPAVLNFQISMWIYLFSSAMLVFVIIGIPLLIMLGIFSSIIIGLNTVKVLNGNPYHYPFSILFIKPEE